MTSSLVSSATSTWCTICACSSNNSSNCFFRFSASCYNSNNTSRDVISAYRCAQGRERLTCNWTTCSMELRLRRMRPLIDTLRRSVPFSATKTKTFQMYYCCTTTTLILPVLLCINLESKRTCERTCFVLVISVVNLNRCLLSNLVLNVNNDDVHFRRSTNLCKTVT